MRGRSIDTDTVLRAAVGRVERELEITGRRWALKLKPSGLVSNRFPHVSLCEHSTQDCVRIDDLPSVLRCLPRRVADDASSWLPVLQSLSDVIDVVNDPLGDATSLLAGLERVGFERLSWLGTCASENDIPALPCFAHADRGCAYSVELHSGRYLGVRVHGERAPAAAPVPRERSAVIELARTLRRTGRCPARADVADETCAEDVATIITTVARAAEQALGNAVALQWELEAGFWIGTVRASARELEAALLDLMVDLANRLEPGHHLVLSAGMRAGRGHAPPTLEISLHGNVADAGESRSSTRAPGRQARGVPGLRHVHAFVKRCGGCMRIDHTEGGSTRVRMQLPTHEDSTSEHDERGHCSEAIS